jgi:predicted nucleic acid-binding protein
MEAEGDGVIVVDTNVIAYLLIKGDWTEKARLLAERDPDWAAPSFWKIEFLNVLVNYARENSFRLTHLREEAVEGGPALELAMRHKISGFDALFVSLAQGLGTVCVTQDQALRRAVPKLMVGLEEFLK